MLLLFPEYSDSDMVLLCLQLCVNSAPMTVTTHSALLPLLLYQMYQHHYIYEFMCNHCGSIFGFLYETNMQIKMERNKQRNREAVNVMKKRFK